MKLFPMLRPAVSVANKERRSPVRRFCINVPVPARRQWRFTETPFNNREFCRAFAAANVQPGSNNSLNPPLGPPRPPDPNPPTSSPQTPQLEKHANFATTPKANNILGHFFALLGAVVMLAIP